MGFSKISLLIMIGLLFVSSCSGNEGDIGESLNNESMDDLETLIATNEQLVSRLESELQEREQLQEEMLQLEEENLMLKDDILTYKQQAIELEQTHRYEQELRQEIDEISHSFFQLMDETNHAEIGHMVTDNISTNTSTDSLELIDVEGVERTFHYLQLDSINYIRQRLFSYDEETEEVLVEYEFHSGDEEDFQFEGGVEIIYVKEEDWKLSSIRYVQ